jgi:hypothetical protein
VRAPTLLIVGSRDAQVLSLNRLAADRLHCAHRLVVVRGAGHLFEEPGALDTVAALARDWFTDHLARPPADAAQGRPVWPSPPTGGTSVPVLQGVGGPSPAHRVLVLALLQRRVRAGERPLQPGYPVASQGPYPLPSPQDLLGLQVRPRRAGR